MLFATDCKSRRSIVVVVVILFSSFCDNRGGFFFFLGWETGWDLGHLIYDTLFCFYLDES